MESKRLPIHARLYQDFFERRNNRELLLRHLEEQGRGLAYPGLTHEAFQTPTRETISQGKTQERVREEVQDARLKLPVLDSNSHQSLRAVSSLSTLNKDSPRSKPLNPYETPLRSSPFPKTSRFRPSLQPTFTPLIGKYYSQLTPFQQTFSYSSGCNLRKIQQEGREMINYCDSQAMLAALGK